MPDYRRKRRSRFKSAPKVQKKRSQNKGYDSDIQMTSAERTPKQKMRVVKGRKLEQKRRLGIFMYALCLLMLVFIVCQMIMPAGVIETVSNSVAVIGSGSYPLELDSSNTLNVVSKGSYYYVLTDTKLNAFSNSGKLIFSYTHGYENPVLKTSKTRALVFEQGGNNALIFTLSGLKSNVTCEYEIINAAIGENGTYAFVTAADAYAAAVRVYKKNGETAFEWFSSEDMVNNVAVSPNGKKIAVSTLCSTVANYNSKISIFNFKSADAEYTKNFENTIVYSLLGSGSGGFSVLTENNYNYISWSGKKVYEYENEYSADMIRTSAKDTVVVFNRESDKTDNRIAVFSQSGKMKTEIEFKGVITDIEVKNGNIYCLSDTESYILNNEGEVLRNANCGFGAVRFAVIGQNTLAVVTDNVISEIKLKQE